MGSLGETWLLSEAETVIFVSVCPQTNAPLDALGLKAVPRSSQASRDAQAPCRWLRRREPRHRTEGGRPDGREDGGRPRGARVAGPRAASGEDTTAERPRRPGERPSGGRTGKPGGRAVSHSLPDVGWQLASKGHRGGAPPPEGAGRMHRCRHAHSVKQLLVGLVVSAGERGWRRRGADETARLPARSREPGAHQKGRVGAGSLPPEIWGPRRQWPVPHARGPCPHVRPGEGGGGAGLLPSSPGAGRGPRRGVGPRRHWSALGSCMSLTVPPRLHAARSE